MEPTQGEQHCKKQFEPKRIYQQPDINLVEKLSAQLLIANRELEALNARLRASEQARKEMLANISHDLRAPATALRCAIDCLLDSGGVSREQELPLLQVMDRRMAVLEHLIDHLYLLTVMDQPDFQIVPVRMELTAFLNQYCATLRQSGAYGDRVLGLELPSEPIRLDASPDYLTRVLDNLFTNALRFTQSGDSIILRCAYRDAEHEAEIGVRDTGCGIPPEHLERIFERTYTLSPSRAPGDGGGLGLAIVRSIVQKHGGRVWCESEVGGGSHFRIRIPCAAAADRS